MGAQHGNEFIRLGFIAKAHGIRGEVSLEYQADSLRLLRPTLFLHQVPGQERLTSSERDGGFVPDLSRGSVREYKVLQARRHQDRPLLLLEGVNDRNAAELLRGQSVLVPRSRLPEPAEGEAYLYQLPGFTVYVRKEDGSVEELGHISGVDLNSGHEVWTILTPSGKEVLFPAEGGFVERLDAKKGEALINPPPGLIELYLEEHGKK